MNNTTQTQTTLTSSSSNNDDDTPTTTQSNNSNRLAPYNPTHATAQSTALNLLSLTSSDIFFDLGCGDGRLIKSAIESCYDDDYLLKVHQERFSKLELYTHEDNSPTGSTSPQQLQPHQPPVRRDVHANNNHNEATKTPPRRTAATQSQLNTPSSISSRKSIQHSSSHSDYSVPHLMRTSSQDDDSECLSGFDTQSTAYRREIISPSSPHNYLSPDKKKTTTQDVVTSVDENGSVKDDDVLSAISPLDQQLNFLQYTSSSSSLKGGGARIPDSPVTPIANNRRLNNVITTLSVRNHNPPLMPNNDNKPELLNGESTTDISDSTIPKTIETPVCSPDGNPKHVIQISELPTDLSHVVGDDIHNVQQEETGEGEESTTAKMIDHPLLSSGYPLSSIPSSDQIDIATSPMKKMESSTKNDTAMGGKAAAVQDNTTNTSRGTTTGSGSSLGDGLQCVGIEYNQALAESAQINVSKSYIYPHVEKKVCIRWGDVLDEWTRGEQQQKQKQEADVEDYKKNGVGNSNVHDDKNYNAWDDHDGEGNNKNDASKLTLLNDATAVFVYLLPQGLKKVKPLLYEAAVRRKRQRDQFMQCKKQMQQQQQIQEQQPQHPLHTHLLQQPLIEKERSSGTMTEDSTEFIPFPPKHLIQHRKGSSHVSDITDCDFRNSNYSKSSEELNKDMARGIILDEVDVLQQSNNMTHVKSIIPPPAFRVVSYMFAVPGWKPTKVDRTSKGSCPLYLYENIHEFLELKDEGRGDIKK